MKRLANEKLPEKSRGSLKTTGYQVVSLEMDNPGTSNAEVRTIEIDEEQTI